MAEARREEEACSSADPRRFARRLDARLGSLRPASESFAALAAGMPEDVRRRMLVDRRVKEVHDQFRRVVDPYILAHTNSVYLMRSKAVEGAYDLVVYVDASICAAELNARRELIRLKYREEFSVVVDVFEIGISRGAYRDKHPFAEEQSPLDEAPSCDVALDADEEQRIDRLVEQLPDGRMRNSFKRAIGAQMKRAKQKDEKNQQKSH